MALQPVSVLAKFFEGGLMAGPLAVTILKQIGQQAEQGIVTLSPTQAIEVAKISAILRIAEQIAHEGQDTRLGGF